ncbi:ACOXL [Branchiostoma lanceolatum]|uniref:Acyl-coenzyme A oxidase n=1 Tax=Branchiostoma lanceolatum TaxID=7740 RepID=A0A8K0EU31_BRALA|nr:ACOXL [Branchiostoma lanceolatum]
MASDVQKVKPSRYIDGEFWELKDRLRKEIEDNDLFRQRFDITVDELRELTLKRAKFLLSLPQIRQQFADQLANKKGFISSSQAIGEVFSSVDMSVGVKMGVMAWLFGGAVMNLGSEQHVVKWFQPLKDLEFTGMFAMSEKGHGSNVRNILTEAHYDSNTQEFIITTPCEDAQKFYIGNALQGNYAAVFAQLIIGQESKGPHCFIVPIRDAEGNLYPGVSVTDMGLKEGLNGVDNGILHFTGARIPRENLLNRFADVSAEGVYTTSIPSHNARFNAMLAALVATRLALSNQATASMKVALEIAIRYAFKRVQFGPGEGPEVPIMHYQTHQLRLMPYLATCLAVTFANRYAADMLDDDFFHKRDLVDNRSIQALISGLKAYATWENLQCLQTCRECCGGMGYMSENRIAGLKQDCDVFVTFEGDNTVLYQQVVKELLAVFGQKLGDNRVLQTLSVLQQETAEYIKTSMFAVGTESVISASGMMKALSFREGRMLRKLAGRMLKKVGDGEEGFQAWNSCLHHTQALAKCHIQRVCLELFVAAVDRCPHQQEKDILNKFCLLYGTHALYTDRAWYLEHGYYTPANTKELRQQLLSLCAETCKHALFIVEAFHTPRISVHAPIAGVPSTKAPWAYYPEPGSENPLVAIDVDAIRRTTPLQSKL